MCVELSHVLRKKISIIFFYNFHKNQWHILFLYFRFPKDKQIIELCKSLIGGKINLKYPLVCETHFQKDFIHVSVDGRSRLRRAALPIYFVNASRTRLKMQTKHFQK